MVDPLSEKYMSMSPYHFSGNNPIVNVDDNGKDYSVYFEQDDDGNLQVRITATYYVEDCDEESYKSAKAGADHWNNQSGKYALIVKDEDGNKSSYSIVFDINVYQVMNPEMERKKDTNNAEDAITPDGSSNLLML